MSQQSAQKNNPIEKRIEDAITREALARLTGCPDARLKEVATALNLHLHQFAREVDLTPDEWLAGIEFLTQIGHMTDHKRRELILLSDTLGLSATVDAIANAGDDGDDSVLEASLLGPFFRSGAPAFESEADISNGILGDKLLVRAYMGGDPYLNSDAVFGARTRSSLTIGDLNRKDRLPTRSSSNFG